MWGSVWHFFSSSGPDREIFILNTIRDHIFLQLILIHKCVFTFCQCWNTWCSLKRGCQWMFSWNTVCQLSLLSSIVPVSAHAHWQWDWAGFRRALLLEQSVEQQLWTPPHSKTSSSRGWQHMRQEKGINHSSAKSPGVLKEVCYLLVKGCRSGTKYLGILNLLVKG